MYKSRTIKYTFCVVAIILYLIVTTTANPQGLACNPRNSHMNCLMGCLSCFETFGGEVYDTAACCRDCQLSGSELLDYGPAKCSHKYVRKSWLKRLG